MEKTKTKRDFIKELMLQAQDNIWKNELAKDFADNLEEKDKLVKVKACEHSIKKDTEYLAFLQVQLDAISI